MRLRNILLILCVLNTLLTVCVLILLYGVYLLVKPSPFTPAPIPTPSQTSEATITPTTLPTRAVVGEFVVSVKRAWWVKALDRHNSSYENGSFLLVLLSVKNIGKSQRLFGIVGEYFGEIGTAEIAVIDSQGYEYPPLRMIPSPRSAIKWDALPQSINPKLRKELIIAFDLPPDVQDLRLGLRASKADEWTLLKIPISKD